MKPSQKGIFKLLGLVFVLVILLFFLFAIVNSSFLKDEKLLSLDHVVLKVLLHTNETFSTSVEASNIVARSLSVAVTPEGVENVMTITPSSFSLFPDASQAVTLDFISSQEGVSVGNILFTAENYEEKLPVIIEVESPKLTFDLQVTLSAYNAEASPGQDALFSVTIYDLNGGGSQTTMLTYQLTDLSGDVVYSDTENYVFSSQTSFAKVVYLPEDLEEGSYLFSVKGDMEGNVATSSYLLKVTKKNLVTSFSKVCSVNSYFCALSLLIVFLLVFFVGATLYLTFGVQIRQARKRIASDTTFALLILFIFIFFIVLLFFLVFNINASDFALVPSFVYWLLLGVAVLGGAIYLFVKHPPHIHFKKKPMLALETLDFDVLKKLWTRRQTEKDRVKKELDQLLRQTDVSERTAPSFFSRVKAFFRKKEEPFPVVAEKKPAPKPLSAPTPEIVPKKKPFFASLREWRRALWKKSVAEEKQVIKREKVIQKKAGAEVSGAWGGIRNISKKVFSVPKHIGVSIVQGASSSRNALHRLFKKKQRVAPVKKEHRFSKFLSRLFAKKKTTKEEKAPPRFVPVPREPAPKRKPFSFHFPKVHFPKIKLPSIHLPKTKKPQMPVFLSKESLKKKILHFLPKRREHHELPPMFKPRKILVAPAVPEKKKRLFSFHFPKVHLPKIKLPTIHIPKIRKPQMPVFLSKESLKKKILHFLPKRKEHPELPPMFKPKKVLVVPAAPEKKKKLFSFRIPKVHFPEIKLPTIKLPKIKKPHMPVFLSKESLKKKILHFLPKRKEHHELPPTFKPKKVLFAPAAPEKKKKLFSFHLPKVHFPKIKLPTIHIPKIRKPQMPVFLSKESLKKKILHFLPKRREHHELPPTFKPKKIPHAQVLSEKKKPLFAPLKQFFARKHEAPVQLPPLQKLGPPKKEMSPVLPKREEPTKIMELPSMPQAHVDPWKRTIDLVNKCQQCVRRNDPDMGEIYYEELKPLFSKLSREEKNTIYPTLVELQNQFVMLRFKKVKEHLKR